MIHVVLLPVPVIDPVIAVPKAMQIGAIQRVVSQRMKVRVEDIKGPTRYQEIARARQVSMYVSRMCTNASLAKIGRMHGNRDHTTVIHSVQRVSELMRTDRGVSELVEEIIETLANLKGEKTA